MSALVPVITTVVSTPINTVITVVITGTNADMIGSARAIFAPVAGPHVERLAQILGEHHTPPGQHLAALPGAARVTEGACGVAVVVGTRVLLDGFAAGSRDALFRALDDRVRADPIMSALVPVITTVVSTPINTVITVPIVTATSALSRVFGSCGALAAATIRRAPHDPNTRDSADVAVTMGTVSAKPAVSSATSTAPRRACCWAPCWSPS
ncbi:hypothetical protein MAHJHV55_52220 [Mycobacterium avium subsp. hominissuis]